MYFKIKETEQCVIPPLLFGLGVETDHATGLKTLLTQLSKLEYTISHDEVKWYKQSVVMDEDNKLDPIKYVFTK